MTSFEIEGPPRLARKGRALDETDIVTVGYLEADDFKPAKKGEDEWKCRTNVEIF